MAPTELALLRSLPWLAVGLAGALLAWFVRGRLTFVPRIAIFAAHLSAMLALVLTAAIALIPLTSAEWFQDSGLPAVGRLMASGVSLTALLTAGIAAVSIASSSALGYRPSLYLVRIESRQCGFGNVPDQSRLVEADHSHRGSSQE
jgi:hypothetical protein